MSKTKVLFVCLGNICRSPAAEGVFQTLIETQGLKDQFEVDSAGTSAYHAGEKADARMREKASARDLELTSISRQFVAKDFSSFDHIIVMDQSNYENVLALDSSDEFHSKVSKMTDYASDKFKDFDHIPDPYYGGIDGFELVLNLLEDCCQGLLDQLKK